MEQYEHKIIYKEPAHKSEEKLNKLGLDGWQVAAVSDSQIFLQRQKKPNIGEIKAAVQAALDTREDLFAGGGLGG